MVIHSELKYNYVLISFSLVILWRYSAIGGYNVAFLLQTEEKNLYEPKLLALQEPGVSVHTKRHHKNAIQSSLLGYVRLCYMCMCLDCIFKFLVGQVGEI